MARRRFIRAMMPPSEDEVEDDRREAADDEEEKHSDSERSFFRLPPSTFADDGNGKPSDDSPDSESSDDGGDASKEKPSPWTEEDVINLLRGMMDFMERREKDPVSDIKEFLWFMSFPARKSQLLAKIQALRLDYEINRAKGNNLSLNPFEAEVFRLSRMIWGPVDVEEGSGKNSADQHGQKPESLDQHGTKRGSPNCPVLLPEMVKMCEKAQLGFGERYLRSRIAMAEESKVKALEERWKKQKLEEASIEARKAALKHDILKALMR